MLVIYYRMNILTLRSWIEKKLITRWTKFVVAFVSDVATVVEDTVSTLTLISIRSDNNSNNTTCRKYGLNVDVVFLLKLHRSLSPSSKIIKLLFGTTVIFDWWRLDILLNDLLTYEHVIDTNICVWWCLI